MHRVAAPRVRARRGVLEVLKGSKAYAPWVLMALGGPTACGSEGESSIPMEGWGGKAQIVLAGSGGSGGAGGAGGAAAPVWNGGSSGAWSEDGGPAADCPEWPVEKLLPVPGPWFYGPDPGPCSLSGNGDITTYLYEDGALIGEHTGAEGDKLYGYNAGRIVTMGDYVTVTYGDGAVTVVEDFVSNPDVESNQDLLIRVFETDERGYPRRLLSIADDGTVDTVWTYAYEGCRVTRLTSLDAEGNVLPRSTTAVYDDEGRTVAKQYDAGATVSFDYSCWQ